MSGKIVMVSKQRLSGATNGSSAYLIAIARSLVDAGCKVHLIQPSPGIAGRTPWLKMNPEMAIFASHSIRGSIRLGQLVLFLLPSIWARFLLGAARLVLRRMGLRGAWLQDRPAPYSIATEWTDADMGYLKTKMPAAPAAVIADYMFCTPAFSAAPPGTPSAIIMHDLFHAREGNGQDSVSIVTREDEIAMLGRADQVFAIQQAEYDFVAQQVPHTLPLLVPMPADPVAAPQPGKDHRLLFVGSNTAPNSVGLAWFLEQVWPLVRSRCQDCELDVAGTVGRAFDSAQHDGVHFHGIVADLEPLYRDAAIVISPLTFGSGLKIKLVEAMAQGKCVVATSVTLQGVEDFCDGAVIREDGLQATAEAILALHADETSRLSFSKAALDCASANFSAAGVHSHLRHWALCVDK